MNKCGSKGFGTVQPKKIQCVENSSSIGNCLEVSLSLEAKLMELSARLIEGQPLPRHMNRQLLEPLSIPWLVRCVLVERASLTAVRLLRLFNPV